MRAARQHRIRGIAVSAFAASILGVGCDPNVEPPASFRITSPGMGPPNAAPVARLIPGTRTWNPWVVANWAVGEARSDGTIVVESRGVPLVFREGENGLELLGQTVVASRRAEGASLIQTVGTAAAEVVVPRELRDGMTWVTGLNGEHAWSARLEEMETPIGPRRVWRITPRDGTSFSELLGALGVIEGVGLVAGNFDPRLDVIVTPAEAPPITAPAPVLAMRPLALDPEAAAAALWFDPRAMQANAFDDGSMVLQLAGSARQSRGVLDGERTGDCFVLDGASVSVGEVEVRPFPTGSVLERGSPRTCRFKTRDLTGGSPSMGTRYAYGLATDASGTQYLSSGEAFFVPRDGRAVEESAAYAWLSPTGTADAVSFPSGYPTPNTQLFTWTRESGGLEGTTWLAPARQPTATQAMPVWWVDARGNVMRAEATSSSRLSAAQSVGFAPGRPSIVAFEGGHEMLTTSPDGLITRFVATPGSERFEALGRVALPPLHVLVGAVRHPRAPGRLVLAVADRSRRIATVFAGGAELIRGTGTLRFFEAEATANPIEAASPPGLALTAVPRGADLVVCGPTRAGALDTTEGWTLGGRAARVTQGPGPCVWVLRPLETTAAELMRPDAWHVHGTLPGVGEFDLGLSVERVESFNHQLLSSVGTPIAGGFMNGLEASSIEGIPLSEPRLDLEGTVNLSTDERGVVWGTPRAEEAFILRADLTGVQRFTVPGAAPRILGPVMGGGFAVRLVPGVAEEARIIGDDGVLGPVIDRAAMTDAFYWPDGFKCRVSNDRLVCFAADATTSTYVLLAGERLPRFARSWGPTRALLYGDGLPTFVFDRTAGTLEKLDARSFIPSEAPDGTLYGVMWPPDGSAPPEVVRLDESGFVVIPVARPGWIPDFVRVAQVSASDDRIAVRFLGGSLSPTMQPLVVYDR